MKIRSSEIVVSAIRKEQYPAEGLPEIALVGRSNVGKSSATNALLNRRNFARTSQTPGKTRTINFYKINILLTFLVMDTQKYLNQKRISGELSWKDIYKIDKNYVLFSYL